MYESTFDSVCELVDIMQDFNLTGDTTMRHCVNNCYGHGRGELDAIKSDHAPRARSNS